jgi:hypothetical protein
MCASYSDTSSSFLHIHTAMDPHWFQC